MKWISIVLMTFSISALAQDLGCNPVAQSGTDPIYELAEPVLQAAQQSFTKLVSLKVKHGGDGDLSILLNPAGEIEAVKFYYKDGKDIKAFVATADELNAGKAIQYPPKNGDVSPLKLMAVRPPGLNPGKGGTFNLVIATKLDPPSYREHPVKLSKENDNWVVDALGVRTKEVVLSPGVSFLSWDGTFQKVEFK